MLRSGPGAAGGRRGGFEHARDLAIWLALGSLVGIAAGLAAVALAAAIEMATELLLGAVVGYLPPAPIGEGSAVLAPLARPWLLPLVTTLGGLLVGLLTYWLAPEVRGAGQDPVIAALHHRRGQVRARVAPLKLLATAITLGSGGSGGREGPAAQISASLASQLANLLRLDSRRRRLLSAAGMAAGVGAIFRAPLGGAVLAAELFYLHDIEVEVLIPAIIAAIVGYTVYGSFYGFDPIFGLHPGPALQEPVQLLYYAALGLLCGLAGILYASAIRGSGLAFDRLPLPAWIRPALGGLLLGLLGLALPQVLHTGYGWLQHGMDDGLSALPLGIVLVLPFAKIVATALTIGSGGAGGVFGPATVVGGLIGVAFWRLGLGVLPGMPDNPTAFAIVGMMALFGSIGHAPLATLLMVAEMSGNLSLLAPAMLAVAIATALVGDFSLFPSQLPDRTSAPAHRVRFSFPLLAALQVRDAVRPSSPTVESTASVAEAEEQIQAEDAELMVVDERGAPVGVVTRASLERIPSAERAAGRLQSGIVPPGPLLRLDQPLDEALETLSESGRSWAPVVENGRVIGRLTARDALAAHRAALGRSIRRARALPPTATLLEARVGAGSPLVGRKLREAGLPRDVLVVSINRGGEAIFPRAETRLEAGDLLTVLAEPSAEPALRRYLQDETGPGPASEPGG